MSATGTRNPPTCGCTLSPRDQLAAAAMTGLLARGGTEGFPAPFDALSGPDDVGGYNFRHLVATAYEVADAMLAASETDYELAPRAHPPPPFEPDTGPMG